MNAENNVNNIYVVWDDITTAGNKEILFKRSTDGGASFSGHN